MKKHFSKLLSMLLALAVLITVVPVDTFAEEIDPEYALTDDDVIASGNCGVTGNESSVQWKIIKSSDEVYKLIIWGNGPMEDYDYDYPIMTPLEEQKPSPWYKYVVDRGAAGQGYISIKEVEIAEGVTHIGNYAFYNLSEITDLGVLPESLLSIGKSTFRWLENVTEINIPSKVVSIGDCAFLSSGIISITIPESVTNMGSEVFSNCNDLTSIIFLGDDPDAISFADTSEGGKGTFDSIPTDNGGVIKVPAGTVQDYLDKIIESGGSTETFGTGDDKKWKVKVNNDIFPSPVVSLHFEFPEDQNSFDPNGEITFDEYINGIKVIALLESGEEEDVSDYCVFDYNDVDTTVSGTYGFSAKISRKDGKGNFCNETIIGEIKVTGKGFNVSYISGDALYGKTPKPQAADENNKVIISGNTGNLNKPGYTFEGWVDSLEKNPSKIYYPDSEETLTKDLVLKPYFVGKYYSINAANFNAESNITITAKPKTGDFDEGHQNELQCGDEGQIIVTAPIIQDTEDNFWALEGSDDVVFTLTENSPEAVNGCNVYTYDFTMPDHYIYAYSVESVAITLNANHDDADFINTAGEKVKTKVFKIGEALQIDKYIDKIPTPTVPDGYYFIGWFWDKECNYPVHSEYFESFANGDEIFAGYAYKAKGAMYVKAIPDQKFSGGKITPQLYVSDLADGNKVLKEGVDYTVTYKNNINANKDGIFVRTNNLIVSDELVDDAPVNLALPYAIISGKGNYKGKASLNFNILPVAINDSKDASFETFSDDVQAYFTSSLVSSPKKAQKTDTQITYLNKALKLGKDYAVSYYKWDDDFKDSTYEYPLNEIPKGSSGKFRIGFEGKGNYTGKVYKDLVVYDDDNYLGKAVVSVKSAQFVRLYDEGTDKFVDNVEINYSVKINGKDVTNDCKWSFIGGQPKVPGTYGIKIEPKTPGADGNALVGYKDVKVNVKTANTKGLEFTLTPQHEYSLDEYWNNIYTSFTDNNVIGKNETKYNMKRNIDYYFDYSGSMPFNAGAVKFSIVGMGIYSGYKKIISTKILPYNIVNDKDNKFKVEIANTAAMYNSKGATADVKVWFDDELLREGLDYTLKFANNKTVTAKKQPTVTVIGKGNFKGSLLAGTYKIIAKPFSEEYIKVVPGDVVFNKNKPVKINFVMYDLESGVKLSAGKDFDKKYSYKLNGNVSEQPPVCSIANIGQTISVTVKANGNYRGQITFNTTVKGKELKNTKLLKKVPAQEYTGNIVKLDPSLYDLTYKIASTEEAEWFNTAGRIKVGKKGETDPNAELSKDLIKGDTILLQKDVDYTCEEQYENNAKIGKANLILNGKGFFAGSTKVSFSILPKIIIWFGK